MSSTQLYFDHARILKPAPAHILIETITDYVPVYARMVEAIHAGQPLTVVVRHPTCAAWLRAAQDKYGPERIQVHEITGRERLAELEGVEVPAWASDETSARQVEQEIAPIHDHLEQELADGSATLTEILEPPIAPPRPPQPNPAGTWSADEWLDWAVEHYLPYRFWLEEIGQYDKEIAAQADAYAEWLYAHYPALRLTYPRMAYQGLLALRDRLAGPAPVLIVVADNLNGKFLPDLARYLQAQGFFAERSIPHLAMLPSCTEVSKKCLFIGQPEPFRGTAYEKPTLAAWESALGGRRVRYLSGIGVLRSVKRREHDVYFLNYTPVDKILHEDEQQTGVPTSAAVRQRLRALAGDVRTFAERIGAEHNLVVIVVSDHGSTRIPAEAPNPIDRCFYASRVSDQHHRYVTISDKELAALPDNVRFECYVFERERFDLPTNYLAARSTYRFAEAGAGIYVHGGLSPEETIVPLTVFTPATVGVHGGSTPRLRGRTPDGPVGGDAAARNTAAGQRG
jgi:hypothetical protein